MTFARQLRGHLRIVATPTTTAILSLIVLAIAARARNAPGMLDQDPAAHPHAVALVGAFRIACLQMSTMAGLAIAAASAATLSGFVSHPRGEEMMSILEPAATRRWLLRLLSVIFMMLAGIVLTTTFTYIAGAVQAARLGGRIQLTVGEWSQGAAVFGHSIVVVVAFAAVAVLTASLFRANPAVAAAASLGVTEALLLLQHLLGSVGDYVVPTAWVARWLHLPARDYGVGYIWTSGAFASHRGVAGVAVATLAALAAGAGLTAVARAARG